MKIKGYAKKKFFFGGGGQTRCIMGDVQVANCFLFFYKKRSRRRHCRCCCLRSAISTVDKRTLIRESDSKAT